MYSGMVDKKHVTTFEMIYKTQMNNKVQYVCKNSKMHDYMTVQSFNIKSTYILFRYNNNTVSKKLVLVKFYFVPMCMCEEQIKLFFEITCFTCTSF